MPGELNDTQTSEAPDGASAGQAAEPKPEKGVKVELDLDDAPFLQEEEPVHTPEPEEKIAAESKKAASSEDSRLSLKGRLLANKKKMLLAGAAAVLLLVAGVCINIFLSSPAPTPPAPEPERVLAAPKPLPEAPVPLHTLQLEPFWIELKDTEGAIRFLTLKFSIPTDNSALFAEMNAKKLVLRDALFYYLRNQPIIPLTDEAKSRAFKGDLLTVMNEHLASGKVSEILIQDYLVQ